MGKIEIGDYIVEWDDNKAEANYKKHGIRFRIVVQPDLRIIRSDTGKVVWRKVVLGKQITTLTSIGMIKSGSAKLTSELYSAAMEDAAQKIVDAIVGDLHARMLIAKGK